MQEDASDTLETSDTSDTPVPSEDPFELLQKATTLYKQGNREEALDFLVRAEHSALTARRPEALVAIYSMAGSVFSGLEDFERSLRYFEKSLQVIELFEEGEETEETEEEESAFTEWSASNEHNNGKLLFRRDQPEEAEKRFTRSIKLYKKLLVADPENVQHLSSLAKVKDSMGNLLSGRGQTDEACVIYTEAADIRRSLRKRK